MRARLSLATTLLLFCRLEIQSGRPKVLGLGAILQGPKSNEWDCPVSLTLERNLRRFETPAIVA